MKLTNYQLFDFLDFCPELDEGDRLWRACSPTDIAEKSGEKDIVFKTNNLI